MVVSWGFLTSVFNFIHSFSVNKKKYDGALRPYRNELYSLLEYMKKTSSPSMTVEEIMTTTPNLDNEIPDAGKLYTYTLAIGTAFHQIDHEFISDHKSEISTKFIKELETEVKRYAEIGRGQSQSLDPNNNSREMILKGAEAPKVIKNILVLFQPVIKSIGTPKILKLYNECKIKALRLSPPES